jgi:outer membrane lipoprotein-sorting protein
MACSLHKAARTLGSHTIAMYLRLTTTILAAVALNTAAQNKPAPSVDELVAKNVQAKGGAEALRNLKSLRLTGKLLVNDGQIQLGYVTIKKRPGEIRTEATLQGMTAVQAYDGTQAWQISPFRGRKDPEKMSADDTKELVEDAEIDGPLVDWKGKGSTVEYLGTEDVDGTQAHKLKVVRKNGDVNFVYLDPDAFLEIRTITQRIQHGAQVETETDIGDYEKIGGVFIPFAIEAGRKGSPAKQKLVIEKAEPNVSVEDAIFHFPATAAK